MNRGATAVRPPMSAGLCITEDYRDWQPTQSWAVERARMVTTRLYAQAKTEQGKGSDGAPVAVHKAAITAQLSKGFGALYDESAQQFSGSWIVDLLVHLGDLGDVGHGYYIPRESRIVRLASQWGRIAGGLPLELSEHSDKGIGSVLNDTVGRLTELRSEFEDFDQDTEHSAVYDWLVNSEEQKHARLWSLLPERTVSRPPEELTVFYNANLRRGRTRGDRWHNKMPEESFVVARIGKQPSLYYLMTTRRGGRGNAWFELEKEEARLWILLAERMAGTLNRILVKQDEQSRTFLLPDMLPKAWTAAILACASTVVPEERGWRVEVQAEAFASVGILLRSANIEWI